MWEFSKSGSGSESFEEDVCFKLDFERWLRLFFLRVYRCALFVLFTLFELQHNTFIVLQFWRSGMGSVTSGGPKREPIFLPFQVWGGHLYSLACGPPSIFKEMAKVLTREREKGSPLPLLVHLFNRCCLRINCVLPVLCIGAVTNKTDEHPNLMNWHSGGQRGSGQYSNNVKKFIKKGGI